MRPPACFNCGGETTFSQQVLPLAPESGARIYTCVACGELTWSPISAPPQLPRVENTARQQQQQIQSNKDEE